jgi:hypothetical protein
MSNGKLDFGFSNFRKMGPTSKNQNLGTSQYAFSHSIMNVWVKSTTVGSTPFVVKVKKKDIVDELKALICDKMKFTFGSPLLRIKLRQDSADVEEDLTVQSLIGTNNSRINPVYFVVPSAQGNFPNINILQN